MAEITAALVKALREKTGAGMMDAKKALVENNGDEAAAIDWLRAKGLSKAAKKSGRTAADGLVAVKVSDDGKTGAIVELNAETDFVARNEGFQKALSGIAKAALDTDGSLESLVAAPAPDGEGSVDDMIKRMIATIGENMTLRRSAKVSADKVASYIHNAETAGMGKVGVLVALSGSGDLEDIGFGGNLEANRDLYAGLRIGKTVGTNGLLYVKGGYTNARYDIDISDGVSTLETDLDLDGYRVGAGGEYAISNNTFIKLEYRYSNYSKGEFDFRDNDFFQDDTGESGRFDADLDRHQVVVGMGIRF